MHSLTHVDGSPIRHLIVAAVGALALLLGNGVVLAQDDDMPGPVEEQVSPSPDEQDEPDSYPEKMRNFGGNPTDIDEDLDNSLPKQDAAFPQLKPQGWANFKTNLHEKHGLKLGFRYQGIYQYASETVTGQDTAAGGPELPVPQGPPDRRGWHTGS